MKGSEQSYLTAVFGYLFATQSIWEIHLNLISMGLRVPLFFFSYVSWKKLVARLPIDYRSVETILCCVFVSGNLGEPVLLPFWLSLPGVYNPGGILLTNQHCHGVLPALC